MAYGLRSAGVWSQKVLACAAMPYSHHPPKRGQPATFISLASLAEANAPASSQVRKGGSVQVLSDRIAALCQALNMQPPVSGLDLDSIGFVLADKGQVESPDWVGRNKVGLFVNCCGGGTAEFFYPSGGSFGKGQVAVSWENGRDGQLEVVCPFVFSAWSQGQNVVVHCRQSFHRGPLGFVALCKKLFGFEPRVCMNLLAMSRTVYDEYDAMANRSLTLVRTFEWATGLQLWTPKRIGNPRPWGPSAAASSQGPSVTPLGTTASSSSQAPPRTAASAADAASSQVAPGSVASKYLYRAMREDSSEFSHVPPPTATGPALAKIALRAIKEGSTERSPFLHFSSDFLLARKWFTKGKTLRQETQNYMCRVDITALETFRLSAKLAASSQDFDQGLFPGQIVDLSTEKAAKPYFSKYARDDDSLTPLLTSLGHAHNVKEVLVAWRGEIPKRLFEVIDDTSGKFVRNLDDDAPQAGCSITTVSAVQ